MLCHACHGPWHCMAMAVFFQIAFANSRKSRTVWRAQRDWDAWRSEPWKPPPAQADPKKFPLQAKPCSREMIRPKPNVTNIPSGNRHYNPRKSSSCNHCCSKHLLYQLFASHRQPAEQSAGPLSEVSMCSRADINSLQLLCPSHFICQQPVTVKPL